MNGQIVFNDTIFDFGIIENSDTIHKHVFYFKNTGDIPVSIIDANCSCNCTELIYSNKLIKPGEHGFVNVIYKTQQGFNGQFYESVYIRINSDKIYKLLFKGEIK